MSPVIGTGRPDARLAGSALLLIHPKFPENIGAAARVACNFGIPELVVVRAAPDEEEPMSDAERLERMLKMATHKAAHLVHGIRECASAREAAAPFHLIVGTTARQGRKRLEDHTPREIMAQVAPLLDGHVRVGLMFGSETSGLTNEDLDLCQFASTIPTSGFASLNLAQAVAIHAYELVTALNAHPFAALPKSDYANSFDLEGMYEHIEAALEEITFLKDSNHVFWMRNIRQFLGRVRLKKREASLIRGVCRKFIWHSRSRGEAGDRL